MAASDYPLASAINAVKFGLSGRAGLRAFREGGGRISDATWYRTIGEVRRSFSDYLDEATRPLNRRPRGDEITRITTPKARGYNQQVSVFVLDKDTGEVEARPFSLRGRGLLTRKAAVNAAVEAFANGVTGSPEHMNEVVLGAAYESTFEYTQGE